MRTSEMFCRIDKDRSAEQQFAILLPAEVVHDTEKLPFQRRPASLNGTKRHRSSQFSENAETNIIFFGVSFQKSSHTKKSKMLVYVSQPNKHLGTSNEYIQKIKC